MARIGRGRPASNYFPLATKTSLNAPTVKSGSDTGSGADTAGTVLVSPYHQETGTGADSANLTVADFYVDPNIGSDSNAGTESAPFKTINKARTAVQALLSTQNHNILVYLRAGNYYLSSTLAFTDADSAATGYTVTYAAYPGEHPRVVGGQPVTGWTQYSGSIYQATLTATSFNRLYENDFWSQNARYPASGFLTTNLVSTGTGMPSFTLNSSTQVVTRTAENWLSGKFTVSSYSSSTFTLAASDPQYSTWTDTSNTKWYAQGCLEFLLQAGQFFYNRSTKVLYYWSNGVTPSAISNQEIIAPLVGNRVISLIGSSQSNLVKGLVFSGIEFCCSDDPDTINRASIGSEYADQDGQGRDGLFYLSNTSGVTIQNCVVRNAGVNGICMAYYNQNNTISGNVVEWAGYQGIASYGYELTASGASDVNGSNTIQNNIVRHCGMTLPSGHGIRLRNSGSNTVTQNTVTNVGCIGINIEGGSGTTPDSTTGKWSQNNTISYNEVSRWARDGGDNGALYSTRTGATATVFDHNWMHDGGVVTNNADTGKGVHCMYLDDWSRFVTVSNNIISARHSTNGSAVYIKGHNNVITNNVIYDETVQVGGWTDFTIDAASTQTFSHLSITKNVINHPNDVGVYWFGDTSGSGGYTAGLMDAWNNNVYNNPSGAYACTGSSPASTVSGLISGGYDSPNSTVSDPLLADPYNNSFIFKSGSPALSNSINQLDHEVMGVQANTASGVSVTSPYFAEAGDVVEIDWSGIPNPDPRDWIGFFSWGAANSAFHDWVYVNSGTQTAGSEATASGKVSYTIPAGYTGYSGYEIRLFGNDSSNQLLAYAPAALTIQSSDSNTAIIPAGDTGTGVDSGQLTTATKVGADTGTGADTASVTVQQPAADTGSGADTAGAAATLTGTDTSNAGVDTSTVGNQTADTGTGADTGVVSAKVPAADTGAGVETPNIVPTGAADTGTGIEGSPTVGISIHPAVMDDASPAIFTPGATSPAEPDLTAADTGTGAETASVTASVGGAADTGSGADTAGILVVVTGTDTGTGVDAAGTLRVTPSPQETGSGADSGAVSAAVPASDTGSSAELGSLLQLGSDTGSGVDTAGTLLVQGADTASGADTAVVSEGGVADTGSGADSAFVVVLAASADTGTGTEAQVLLTPASDALSGVDFAGPPAVHIFTGDASQAADDEAVSAVVVIASDTASSVDAGLFNGLITFDRVFTVVRENRTILFEGDGEVDH